MGRITSSARGHDYNRAIRDIASSPDWQSGLLSRQLGRLAEVAATCMGVARAGIWRMQADHQALDCACLFDTRSGRVESAQPLRRSQCPAYFSALQDAPALAVRDVQHDSLTAELVETYFQPRAIQALLAAPIWLDGEWVGMVSLEHAGETRVWRDEDVDCAASMGDFAAMAMSQNRHQGMAAERERIHALETQLRTRTRELEYANRNLASFAYSVSHDLKAPLRGIQGYSRLLLTEYRSSLPDAAGECVELMAAASQRMDQMIEAILAYSCVQMRALDPVSTDVNLLVERVLNELDPGLRHGVELELDMEPDNLVCDREGLVQVLHNFVSNALKFSRNSTPPRIRIEGRRQATGYRFAVQDNGTGFDMRYHDRLFDMFYQLPGASEQEGGGIGLALSARSAERLDGRIWAESVPGQGATFFLELNSGMQA